MPMEALREIARVFGVGAGKYANRNWERGYDWGLSYAACIRHLTAFWGGEELDQETGLSHLAHAAWHCMVMMEFVRNYPELDDRSKLKEIGT